MKHFTKLNKRTVRQEVVNESALRDTSGDDSTEASSEEQSDVLDFFVKSGECTTMDTSVINVSDEVDDDNVSKTESIDSKNHVPTKNGVHSLNFVPRKRGRPPKITPASNNTAPPTSSSGMPYCNTVTPGRTKPDYKSLAPNLQLTTSRPLNCAIKFGEPVGMLKKVDRNVKRPRDDEHDPDVAILNRPKRFVSQKQGACSTDEENVDMSWHEMRDLKKALAASLRKKDTSPSDPNTANAQRKFVQSENIPKKRGRKKKEASNILVNEKAYTEDFINFLCLRSSLRQHSLPTSSDLFTNCITKETSTCSNQ